MNICDTTTGQKVLHEAEYGPVAQMVHRARDTTGTLGTRDTTGTLGRVEINLYTVWKLIPYIKGKTVYPPHNFILIIREHILCAGTQCFPLITRETTV